MKKNIAVLTGAGISQESGISTFRDSNGLWENHDIMEVASPIGFKKNPELVLQFYNQRRAQLNSIGPNPAHYFLAELENHYNVTIITQNVDDLHERAGSSQIIHLHGELRKMRSEKNDEIIFDIDGDINLGDLAEDGGQLRPHIVWFGEAVPEMSKATEVVRKSDIFIVIGTSLQVYPAAALIDYTPYGTPVYIIDPAPTIHTENSPHIQFIQAKAVEGSEKLREILLQT